ncbi:MAG: RNA-binding transcriptional accessory protein [Bdellovibrionales bacterium]|nr:RNA-binding transcriptional accessory protein [Bdellovibrionales bacterium]
MSSLVSESFKNYLNTINVNFSSKAIEAVLALSAEGATVPFIARYRKEQTGNLDEVQVMQIIDNHSYFNELIQRKEFVSAEIAKQGALSSDIEAQIKETYSLTELEEIYRPFKRKKKTKATLAKEAGLEPLSDWLWQVGHGEIQTQETVEVKAKSFINIEKGFVTYEEVLRGAGHILTEVIYNKPHLRKLVKDEYFENAVIKVEKGQKYKGNSKYEMYKEFSEGVKSIKNKKASHRYLAIRRGWQEGELKVNLEADDEKLLLAFKEFACSETSSSAAALLNDCAKSALMVHVIPSICNELHKELKEQADLDAIDVFSENVKKILLGSPFGSKVVLGVDPGIRTGCKVALVDSSGNFISHTVLYVQGDKAEDNAKKLLGEVLKQISIQAIAVGNGTGGREAEEFLRKILKDLNQEIPVVLVNESGASVYSASEVAREEFPDLDLTVRGAISIARRLQDPLSELVKIEPKSIGVGQYQHDVNQHKLKKSLHSVVESCVNKVGINLNTASFSLLQYVSGVGPTTAKNIVQYRAEKGQFKEKGDLMNVPRFSSKVYEQCVGFLRIPNSPIPLDNTGIHPERYGAVRDMAKEAGVTVAQLMGKAHEILSPSEEKWINLIGEYTFRDIVKELDEPGLDPRDPFKVFKFREDIHEVKDLQEGMVCPGIITNVTNFGAFVDIGVHQDGLVHISEICHDFVDDPRKKVSPGDQVQVKVLKVDQDKNQISLSMLLTEKPKVAPKFKGKDHGVKSSQKPKDKNSKGKKFSKSSGKGPHPGKRGGGHKPKGPKPAFNNPFGELANLGLKK